MSKKKVEKRMKRLNITLDEGTIAKLKQVALGNLSMAIRLVVRDHKLKK